MTKYHQILLTAAATLGLTLSAFAGGDDPNVPAPAPAPAVVSNAGLLGQTYAGLTYRYINFDSLPGHADDYRFNFNEPLKTGLDGLVDFNWTDSGAGTRQQAITAGLRAYCPVYTWGKPFAEASGGYTWGKTAGVRDDSFLWQLGIGAELQAAPEVTVTPYIRYADAPSLNRRASKWDFGVKANYWVNRQWSVTVGLDRDDDQNTGFMVGTNFRY